VAAAAVLLLLLAGLGLSETTGVTNFHGAVIRFFSPEGTLVVEVDDPEVRITLDGDMLVITGAGAKEIRVRPGEHWIEATKDGMVVQSELFTVHRDGRQIVRVRDSRAVRRVPAAPNPPARQALDLKYIPADASAAVVAYPRRILQAPVGAGAIPPGAADEMVKELGVKPEQVEQVLALLLLGADPADPTPVPGAIIRFTEPTDGKRVLTGLLKGLREEKHEGKTYYRSSTGEAFLGLPLAGAIPDERTVILAPEPVLRKMLAADGRARTPLLDRLRQTDNTDEITGIFILEPYRNLLGALAGQFKALLPPNLADAASLPDRVVAVTAAVNLRDKTLLKVTLEADTEESVAMLDDLAFKGLNWARKVYPEFRPTLLKQIPAEVVRPALAVVDQLYGGIEVTKEGKRLVIRLAKPEGFDASPGNELIASSGFNNHRGVNSSPVPGSPFPLDTPNREGGVGEPGWAGPWDKSPDISFQSKVVFEGDGALYLKGRPNFGPYCRRVLTQPQTTRFQVEYRVQVPAGTNNYALQIWKDYNSGPFSSGPISGVHDGKFTGNELPDSGFKSVPGQWHKVTMRIDIPKQNWELFVDDKHYDGPQPLKFRAKVESLSCLTFIVGEGGVYIDDVRVTRLPSPAEKDLIASAGFNNHRGMNSTPVPGTPYPLDGEGKQGGAGEPGWAGPWSTPSSPRFAFQKKVVHEGDGALYLSNGGADRRLAEAQRGEFRVEMFVQVPGGGGSGFYLKNGTGAFRDGPAWAARDGKFWVMDGSDNWRETGFTAQPRKWHKVTLRVDVPHKEWQFFVDDKGFETPKPLRFRSGETSLDTIRLQCETEAGIYVDALRFTRLPAVDK
jgi:hypothetical protein